MHFTNLQINNFLTLGEGIQLNLAGKGLNLLQGVNSDDSSASSNGAGKSSVVDALCWALYGTTARGESGDAVVNSQVKKNCLVSVDVVDGSTTYRIARGRKHATLKNGSTLTMLPLGGAPVELTKGTEKETQAEIIKVLGCPEEVFVASVYAGQEQMPDIPSMTDKNLKMLIEEAAGVTRLEKAYRAALDAQRTAEAAFTNVQTGMASAQSLVHSNEVAFETLKIKAANADAELASKLALLEAAREKTAQALSERETKLAASKPAIEAAEAKLLGIQTAMKNISEAQAQVNAYRDGPLRAAQKALDLAEMADKSITRLAQNTKDQLDNAAQEMSKPCEACGKPHTPDELDEYKAHLKTVLTERLQEVAKGRKEKLVAQEALDAAKTELARLQAGVPDAAELTATAEKITNALMPLRQIEREVAGLRSTIESDARQIATLKAAPNPHASAIDHALAQIKAGRERVAQAAAELLIKEEEVKTAEGVAKTFSPAGVRAHILDTVTPFLNDRTASYLGVLSDGNITATWSTLSRTAKGELREKFEIEVANAKGGGSFKLLSGGEKRKVRLACMLALQDLVASRASKPIDLWVGDEVDDALDPAGLERLMIILEMKARERGTVIVVSHGDLRDWIDDVTVVEKKGGSSTVTGPLCV